MRGEVPDLIGLSRERATGLVRRAGFRYRVHLETTADLPDGQVISTRPAPGKMLEEGATVDLIVARQPAVAGITVPDVVGKPRAEAEKILRAESFLVRATYTGADGDRTGTVADQEPGGGTSAGRRTWVEITVYGGSGARRQPVGGPPPRLDPGRATGPGPVGGSSHLTRAPAVGEGAIRPARPTATGARPVKPVALPPSDAPATLTAPDLAGQAVRNAITGALIAGFIPIVEVRRAGTGESGVVLTQSPKAGAPGRAGALLRLGVRVAGTTAERYVSLPTALGGLLDNERDVFRAAGQTVQVVEVDAPGHPYAGTGRVAAQFPVSSVPRSLAKTVTLWVIR